jgi:nitrogen fixation protein FixH
VPHRFIIALGFAVALAACSSKTDTTSSTTSTATQSNGFSISTQFAPDPPKQGPETITVTVKDASGNPVEGANVKIVTKMPAMSMDGPTLTATDGGGGAYAAQTNLNYGTQWTFDVAVSAHGNTGTAHLTQDVK